MAVPDTIWTDVGILSTSVNKYVPPFWPSSVVITRSGDTFNASWRMSGDATNSTKHPNDYVTGMYVRWMIHRELGDGYAIEETVGGSTTSASVTLAELAKKAKSGKFYPFDNSNQMTKVTVEITTFHDVPNEKKYGDDKGKRAVCKKKGSGTFTFKSPSEPSSTLSFEAGNVTFDASFPSDSSSKKVYRQGAVSLRLKKVDGTTVDIVNTTTTGSSYHKVTDISKYIGNIGSGQAVVLDASATSRGFRTSLQGSVTKTLTIGVPGAAVIEAVTRDNETVTARITVKLKSVGAYTEQVQLQRRHGEDGSWEDVTGAVDDDTCKALYDSYGGAAPVVGEKIYYRVKSTGAGYEVFGEPFFAECLFVEKPEAQCSSIQYITEFRLLEDETSARVTLSYEDMPNEAYGKERNDGCEISWSDSQYAWESTEGPNRATFDDDEYATEETEHGGKTSVVIAGLSKGKVYYLRARRYVEIEGETYYSRYNETCALTMPSAKNDYCKIVSATPDEDGAGCTLLLGIVEDNENTGIEWTWSDYEHSWTSNEQPSDFDAEWLDSTPGDTEFNAYHTFHLRGLDEGTKYYVRARIYLDTDDGTEYSDYSAPFTFATVTVTRVLDLRCALLYLAAGDDGASAQVVTGVWGDHTGVEVSWSKDAHGWESTEQPSTFEADWLDSPQRFFGCDGTCTVYINGLDEGVLYYVRVRSFYEDENGDRTYSDYTSALGVASFTAPDSVVASAPDYVRYGDPIDVYWTVSGEMEQKSWRIVRATSTGTQALATGTGGICHGLVTPVRYGDADSVTFHVEASCGGDFTSSNDVSVGIARTPSCSVSTAQTCTAQPQAYSVTADSGLVSLLVTLSSNGVSRYNPDGNRDQLEGDVIWTSKVTPAWVEQADGSFSASLELPVGLELVDGGFYTLSVRAVEPIANLASDVSEATFKVAWAHQAPVPSHGIAVDVNAEALACAISLVAPDGYASGDVYDLYRKTQTGYDLIASDLPLECTVVDRFAPYGADAALDYAVCCRTFDGDEEFSFFPYELAATGLRFDWGDGRSVTLPWNLELSDKYEKSYESREHLDGSVNGYFERAVSMNGSYTTDLNRAEGLEQVNALRELGEYPGAVFCRTSYGAAFQCNAEVRSLSTGYLRKSVPASIEVQAMDLTGAFTVSQNDVVEGE